MNGFLAADANRSLTLSGQSHDGAQRGGAPGAVATEQRDDFAASNRQIHAMQDVRFAVPGLKAFDFQCGHIGALATLATLIAAAVIHSRPHPWAPCSSPSAVPI